MSVLVALDYSPCSRLACEWAVQRAESLFASPLLFHHVVDPEEVEVGVLERGLSELRAYVSECVGAEVVGARYAVVTGQPAQEILHAASVHRAQTIVMGTHGRRGLDRLLLGSVAEAVIRDAPCTVVVVKPGPQQKETA